MASIEGIYQLLIVSYVLASGLDLVTPSRGSSERLYRFFLKFIPLFSKTQKPKPKTLENNP
jgi:hypothetical protein